MHPTHNLDHDGRGALSVEEFCKWAGVSRSHLYKEAAAGRIALRKTGRKSVIAMQDARAWLAGLPSATIAEAA